MKVCPKCGKTWPETGKFCPMDGTPLVAEVEEDEPGARPTRILSADELPTITSEERPAKPPAPAARPVPPPATPVPEAKPAPRPPAAPAAATPRGSEARPASPPPKPPAPAVKPASVEEPAPAEPDRPGAFSETKWFMIGEHIKDEEVEASDLPVEDLQEIYKRTGTLPEEVRKKYSLRYGTNEDRSSDQGTGKKKKK